MGLFGRRKREPGTCPKGHLLAQYPGKDLLVCPTCMREAMLADLHRSQQEQKDSSEDETST